MRVVITCGPSFEPIDEVRRITNFSTGELGILLANRLTRAGHEVLCFKGTGATCPERVETARVIPFSTNESLRTALVVIEKCEDVRAVFHAAALSDFTVKSVHTVEGGDAAAAKIPSLGGELLLTLAPAPKLIPELRVHFPRSRIVGWKYELDGTREDALTAADRQIAGSRTDACVVNGAAYGPGFGIHQPGHPLVHCADKPALCEALLRWLDGAGG